LCHRHSAAGLIRFPIFSATNFPSGRNSFSFAIGFPFGSRNETRTEAIKPAKKNCDSAVIAPLR
jgi:hypothetical protein